MNKTLVLGIITIMIAILIVIFGRNKQREGESLPQRQLPRQTSPAPPTGKSTPRATANPGTPFLDDSTQFILPKDLQ